MIKKYKLPVLLSLFILSININALDIDKIIEQIKDIRKSNISKEELEKIDSPIVALKKKEIKKDANETKIDTINKESFNLKAIIDNKAFINDKWYNKGDKIGSYTIVDIMDNAVYLKNKRKEKIISFNKEDNKFIKIIKRGNK